MNPIINFLHSVTRVQKFYNRIHNFLLNFGNQNAKFITSYTELPALSHTLEFKLWKKFNGASKKNFM